MPTTIDSSGYGFIVGAQATSHEEARAAEDGVATNNPTSAQTAIQAFKSAGRGGGTYRFSRFFVKFDVSSITNCSAVVLDIPQSSAAGQSTVEVFVVKGSGAFSDEDEQGNAILHSSDFNNVTLSGLLSNNTSGDSWVVGTGTTSITLNNDAISAINSSSEFQMVVISAADYNDTELASDGDTSHIIDFTAKVQLQVTVAVPHIPYLAMNSGKYTINAGKIKI